MAMQPESLYAAYASYREEQGGRAYWLLKTKGKAEQAKKAIKVEGGAAIRAKQWYIKAQWYLSTSNNQSVKHYELLDDIVCVPLSAIIQEHGLKWARESRDKSYLSQESHLALMAHNYSNVA